MREASVGFTVAHQHDGRACGRCIVLRHGAFAHTVTGFAAGVEMRKADIGAIGQKMQVVGVDREMREMIVLQGHFDCVISIFSGIVRLFLVVV